MNQIEKLANSPVVQVIAIVALILSALFIGYSTMKKESMEMVHSAKPDIKKEEDCQEILQESVKAEPVESQEFASTNLPEISEGEITPQDLLPKPCDVKAFEAQFPEGQGDVTDKNFLVAGYNIGINTVSSSLKNPNLQLRSDPYIPREETGPWNQSTILSSDLTNRKTLEIGSSC